MKAVQVCTSLQLHHLSISQGKYRTHSWHHWIKNTKHNHLIWINIWRREKWMRMATGLEGMFWKHDCPVWNFYSKWVLYTFVFLNVKHTSSHTQTELRTVVCFYTACDILHMKWSIWCTSCLHMWFICCFWDVLGPWSYNCYVWDHVYGQFRQKASSGVNSEIYSSIAHWCLWRHR